jgi:hypothetical protein
MLDRRSERYGLEAKHACGLRHAGIVRVLDRTRWHDPAGPSLAGLAFSSSEALYEASVQLSQQGRPALRNSERCRGTLTQKSEAIRVLDRVPSSGSASEAVAGQKDERSDLDSGRCRPKAPVGPPSTGHP